MSGWRMWFGQLQSVRGELVEKTPHDLGRGGGGGGGVEVEWP